MEYHYSDLELPNDPTMSGPFPQEFSPQYLIPTKDADYELRSSMLVDGGDRFGVSSVVFDKYEELIWMGNQGGHVTSYYGPTMQKYTSFQVHATDEIRDIVTHEEALFILTKTQLRQQIRRGIPKHTYKSQNMIDMQCLYQESSTKLLMGGHQDKLLELDITKMVETVIPIKEKGCAVLRSGGGSLVACGSACGTVALRDIRTSNIAEHTFKAHSACLSDLDMQGDLLITCGFTQSNDDAVAESYVIVWDVRYLRNNGKDDNVWTVPTASPPLLLHFLPAFSGRAVASAGDGHVALLHINDATEKQAIFQVDTQSTVCTVMDVAATSQALVFGDQSGHLNLFSPQHNNEPHFNQFSRATEFATPVDLPTSPVGFNDTSFRYSSIPLPTLPAGSRWFNEMPPSFYRRVYRKPKPIDPEVLKSMKMQGPIGYAPNPKTCRRNEMPYIEDKMEDLNATRHDRNATQPIPQRYLKMDFRYIRAGPKHVMDSINQTGMPGIESTLPNSYCNAMLQVLYYTAPLKATLLAHTCAKEFCISCELGFLFRMLETNGGTPCQASNFLRAFRTVPEAAALGLILPDRGPDPRVDLVGLIQSWNRFILHQMHYELLETRRKELELQILANSLPKAHHISSIKHNGPIPMPPINGHYEKYQFTEIEFLGPTEFLRPTEFLGPTEFEDESRDEPWFSSREEEYADYSTRVDEESLTDECSGNELNSTLVICDNCLNSTVKCQCECDVELNSTRGNCGNQRNSAKIHSDSANILNSTLKRYDNCDNRLNLTVKCQCECDVELNSTRGNCGNQRNSAKIHSDSANILNSTPKIYDNCDNRLNSTVKSQCECDVEVNSTFIICGNCGNQRNSTPKIHSDSANTLNSTVKIYDNCDNRLNSTVKSQCECDIELNSNLIICGNCSNQQNSAKTHSDSANILNSTLKRYDNCDNRLNSTVKLCQCECDVDLNSRLKILSDSGNQLNLALDDFGDIKCVCETEPIQPIQPIQSMHNSENPELDEKPPDTDESEISELFAIGRHQLNRCLKCNKEEGRESVVLACALQYPSITSRENEQRGSFIELIRASLSSRRSTPAWCEQCGKFTPTSQRGRLIRLPPILAINCGGVNVREKAYWAKGSQKDMPEAKRGASSKPCRYGLHCARPGCHFKHPESPNTTQSSSSKSPSHEASCVLPLQLMIRLQSDGDVIVNDKLNYDTSSSEPNSPNHRVDSKFKKKIITTPTEEEYSLTAAVVCVEDNPKNLIAFIQTDGRESDWYMFNDLSITPVSVEEVVQFSAWWKTPCVLFYTSAQILNAVEPIS